jgi:sulfur carrier protein
VHIVVNGDTLGVAEGETVAGLLGRLGLGAKWVLVERNGQPVNRAELDTTTIVEGDRLELVRAVAGG